MLLRHERPTYKLLVAAVFLLLGACATTSKYEASLDTWKGSTDKSLLQTWGQPTETYASNGHTFLVYRFYRTKPLSIMADRTGNHGGHMKDLYCMTIFDVSEGLVVDWAIKGNDCKDVSRAELWRTAF